MLRFQQFQLKKLRLWAVMAVASGASLFFACAGHAADVQIERTVNNGFVHPGIGLTKEMLENARQQVRDKKEPWISGFLALAADPNSAKNVKSHNESPTKPGQPQVDAFDGKSVENRLRRDATTAKQQTLMYVFTGDEVYRANAMNIVRVWSHMEPAKYKAYSEVYIHASYPIQDLIMAAELLRSTSAQDPKLAWTETDTRNFSENFALPAAQTFLDGNGWFMNQSGYPLAASISSAIFRNDREDYAKRVEWFTVNKTAPNKGWAFSIRDLIRRVDTDALTGAKVARPVVQIVEMGRDQAHGGDDVDIFMNIARQLNAQNTKVDPITGTISQSPTAVGPYEFLDDRILAGANQFWRFMLGYDTPWIPTPSDIGSNGEVRQIYPRIADAYRGRLAARELLDVWDAYYYYAFQKGVDVARKAPYYHEAFSKRTAISLTSWISIPANVAGTAARPASRVLAPDVVEIEHRTTPLSDKVQIINEKDAGRVRLFPSAMGTRFAILNSDTGEKTVALRLRTTGVAQATMSGLAKPWLWPDTGNQWRTVFYRMSDLERFKDIEFFSVTGAPSTTIEIDHLVRVGAENMAPPTFRGSREDETFVTAVGVPLILDLGVADVAGRVSTIHIAGGPQGANLNSQNGEFTWTPTRPGGNSFIVSATSGEMMVARRVRVAVADSRQAAVRQIVSTRPNVPYVAETARNYQAALRETNALPETAQASIFAASLMRLQAAANALQPLTPLLPDGSMDFPRVVATSNIGASIGLLTDGNDDTYPVYSLAKELNHVLDFGPNYRVAVAAFALEGRLNFENRTQDSGLFGSNDGQQWTLLSEPIAAPPIELTKFAVKPELASQPFRYLKLQKMSKTASPLFEPAELRLYGQRFESAQP